MKYDEFITKVGGRADVSLETADALTAATLQKPAERISGVRRHSWQRASPESSGRI